MPEYPKSILEEQLRGRTTAASLWPWRLLLFTIIVFGMSILVYVGTIFGYKPYLESRLNELDGRITELSRELEVDEPRQALALYSQLVNIQNILNAHPVPSKFFELLEKNTDAGVYYLNLTFSVQERSVKLEGVAADYNSLTRQLELFRGLSEVRSVFLDDSKTREQGGIQFIIRLIFEPTLLKYSNQNNSNP